MNGDARHDLYKGLLCALERLLLELHSAGVWKDYHKSTVCQASED